MQTTLKEFVDKAYEFQAEMINGSAPGDDSMPHFLAEDSAGGLHLFAVPWADDEEKYKALATLRKYFAENDIIRYVSMTEAWSLKLEKGESPGCQRPSEDPRRIEVLICCGVNKQGETASRVSEIVLADDGKRHLDPEYMPDLERVDGLMVSLLR